jgi:hypothetical protein
MLLWQKVDKVAAQMMLELVVLVQQLVALVMLGLYLEEVTE